MPTASTQQGSSFQQGTIQIMAYLTRWLNLELIQKQRNSGNLIKTSQLQAWVLENSNVTGLILNMSCQEMSCKITYDLAPSLYIQQLKVFGEI